MEYSSKFKLTLRILVTPFVASLILISYIGHAIRRIILYVRYGGEFITYEKGEIKTIEAIYRELKNETHPLK